MIRVTINTGKNRGIDIELQRSWPFISYRHWLRPNVTVRETDVTFLNPEQGKTAIRSLVEKHGASNVMIQCEFRPVNVVGPIAYTSSNDPSLSLPAIITEERYAVSDGYKIQVECIVPGFGSQSFYQTDFDGMWRDGRVSVWLKENCRC